MSWQREGQRVNALYLGKFPCVGVVTLSRVTYGGTVKHTVRLDSPIEVYGETRDSANLVEADLAEQVSEEA